MWWRVGVILAAGVAAAAPLPPMLVERAYSTTVYPRLQFLVTTASNLAPFALLDVLIIGSAIVWITALVLDFRRGRGGWMHIGWTLTRRTVVWAAVFLLMFFALWGLNYRRAKLSDRLQFDESAISPAAVVSTAIAVVDRLNAIHGRAHEIGWPSARGIDGSLVAAFDRVQRELGVEARATIARPKLTVLDPYFRRAGVVGMTDPFFLETLVESDLLPFERPAVVAHEWSHLAGFADESEASFVGWLTCIRGSMADEYSGWLALYEELSRAAGRRNQAMLSARLASGPRTDLLAVANRLKMVNPTVSAAGWQVYDRYLKANRVEAGAASYGDVVRLVLGVRFGPGWMPKLAAPLS
jgi:hypothetical protein